MGTDRVFARRAAGAPARRWDRRCRQPTCAPCSPGPGVMASHREDMFHRVQDAYSLRCSPQVHGAARDTVEHAATIAGARAGVRRRQPGRRRRRGPQQRQLPRGAGRLRARLPRDRRRRRRPRSASGARDRFLDKARNHDLPPFLADDPGVDSGHMIAQYTQAAIVSEMKRLAVPASVDSIPSSGHAGGPRVDGLERRSQAAPLGRRAVPRRRDRAAHRGPGARPAPAARARGRHRRRRRPAARRTASRAPAPTATCPRRSRPRSRSSSPARCSPPSKTKIGELQ